MPDSKGKKLADALYGQPEEKAAFGVFPQMKPRRSKQDPEAAKDVPRQLLRGWAAGTLGLPGDIEGLIRMLPGLDETPRLPTSEFYLDYLPGKAEGESGKTAAAAGTLFGGLGSTKVARGALEAGKGAAKLAERAAAMPSPSGLAAQRGVVKLPGGQWIGGDAAGSVQREAALLTPTSSQLEDIARLKAYVQRLKESNASAADVAAAEQSLRLFSNDQAIHDWVKSNLSNYIKKQMGTPDDPVRKLAEEGIVHVQPPPAVGGAVEMFRKEAGFPPEGMGVSPQARAWEEASDEAIEMTRAKEYQSIPAREKERLAASAEHRKILDESKRAFIERVRNNPDIDPEDAQQLIYATDDRMAARIMGREAELQEAADRVGKAMSRVSDKARRQLKENPWISKLEGETPVYGAGTYGLGFDHIIDVLRQDLAAGRIRPEQLNKVSMEQAVRRTYEYDQEMAKKMAEAQIKATEGMPIHKEYPEGYKWIELSPKYPEVLPEGFGNLEQFPKGVRAQKLDEPSKYLHGVDLPDLIRSIYKHFPDTKGNPEKAVADALKYEGETMGHCVGGYCPDVLEGRSRIFSLRDAKGEPHVTVEVEPKQIRTWDDVTDAVGAKRGQELWDEFNASGGYDAPDRGAAFQQFIESKGVTPVPSIVQIKGKQNLAPKEEYLPYVQDFVKGGQWSQVGDLKNTGLRRAETPEGVKYLTENEYGDHILRELGVDPAEGMKRGGKVHISDNPDTMRLELAGGGAPKAIAQRLKTLREQLAERAAATEAIQARDRKLPLEQIPEGSLTPEAIEAEIKRMREEKGMAAGGAAKALKALAKGAKEEEKAAIKASEALGQVEGRPLLITQADRSKVGGKWLGGPGFSGLQHTRPEYKAAEAAWGVAQPATAKTILGGYQKAKKEFGAEPVMTTMLGTPTQHQSNKMVFEELHRLFKKSAKDGNLDPELLDKINTRLRMAEDKQGKPIFPEDVNILAPDFRKVANTFDRRAVASNLMGGMTVGGKKGQIIDYDEVIRHTTDPALLEAPSGALGNRMFTLSGGIVDRPDLHPAFPSILQGEDLNVMFSPVARELVMRDFIERTMREKGRTPGYMDYTRGYPPTQLITEELLTDLQKKGFAEGGAVSGISGDDLIIEERPL